jgi:hypothetical protein
MKKMFLALVVFVICFGIFTTGPFAASVANNKSGDGLVLSIDSDKDHYAADEDISVSITAENTNSFAMENVSIEGLLPDGLELKSGILSKQAPTLGSGEILTISAVATQKDDANKVGPGDAVIDNPKTNDSSGIVFWVLLSLISIGGLFLIIKNRKMSQKVISVFLCLIFLASVTPFNALAATGTTQKTLEVSKAITVDEEGYSLKAVASYANKSSEDSDYDPIEDDSVFTRGQWIKLLTEKLDIGLIDIGEDFDYFYGDSKDSEYGTIVETAQVYGLLPYPDSEGYEDPEQDIPLFEAERLATREFAAYTIAKGMGFEGDYTLDCSDLASLEYPSEVAVVVQQGFLTLKDGSFSPNKNLLGTDKNRIFDRIDYFDESLEVDESDLVDEITLREGVLDLADSDYTLTEKPDGTFEVILAKNDTTDDIVAGKVFILQANDEFIAGIALKAISVDSQGSNLILTCEVPEIEEVLSDFNFAGFGVADIPNMTLAEGVTAEYDPNGTIISEDDDQLSPFDIGGSVTMPGKLKFKIGEKKIGDTGVKIKGDFEFSIPDVTAKAKGDISLFRGFSLDELTVSITNKFKVEGGVTYDFGVPEAGYDIRTGDATYGRGKTELGRIPIALGATGLSLDFVLFVNIDVSGKATISYTLTNTTGFQFKDGAFRTLKDYTTEFRAIELNASAKLGLGLAARISLFSVFDLAGVDAHAGLGLTAKFKAHTDVDPNLYCGDGAVYLYATLELDDDTLLIDILEKIFRMSWSWDIFDEDDSPFKLKLHLENAKRVPECTYGKGSILGLVKDAETDEAIRGARIRIYNDKTNALVTTKFSEQIPLILSGLQLYEGEFLIKNLPTGKYRLEVSATGYQSYSINVDVLSDQRVVCEAALMLLRDNLEGPGVVKGQVTDALTGGALADVNYIVRRGWNNIDGEVVTQGTTTGTSYSIELAPGNYSIEFSKGDYINVVVNVVIRSDAETNRNVAINPISDIEIDGDGFRVVLTWGEHPRDLDSHLYLRDLDGNAVFHTSYYNMYYRVDGEIVGNLDLDDVSSYGPETSTVYSLAEEGTYSFYVHDYTNRNSQSSTALANSGAQVKLYSGEALLATFTIPQNREGTLWHVFDYDIETDEFTIVNECTYSTSG